MMTELLRRLPDIEATGKPEKLRSNFVHGDQASSGCVQADLKPSRDALVDAGRADPCQWRPAAAECVYVPRRVVVEAQPHRPRLEVEDTAPDG